MGGVCVLKESFSGGGGGNSDLSTASVCDPLTSCFCTSRSDNDGDGFAVEIPEPTTLVLASSPGDTVEYDSFALLRSFDELVDDLGVDSEE